ncbi:hypothetical protein BC940DRAFT_368666 [Gongronella butleri]|nr:hypothetical protein BC940DRAFT_368666 [Gongronella butleri]
MKFRSLISITTLVLATVTAASPTESHRCKCTAKSSCWPSQQQWNQLNSTVHGRLVTPHQPFYPCHDPHYDAEACRIAQEHRIDEKWATDQAGALTNERWLMGSPYLPENQTCGFNTTRSQPCPQGNVPVYAVDVHEQADMQAGVRFASKHNLRLVIRATGHDILGRSTAMGSFSIWTRHLNKIAIQDSFVAAKCNMQPQHAITVQAGAQWYDVYKAASAIGRVVVGGADITVGAAGGYIAGGGHSALSPAHGLAVDNVLQFTVITAQGDVVVANDCQNSDLFWALRGGGGSTFGVVYDVTYKTHEDKPMAFATFVGNGDKAALKTVVNRWNELLPKLSDEGYSGYFEIAKDLLAIQYILFDNQDLAKANKTIGPFVDFAKEKLGDHVSFKLIQFPNYWSYIKTTASCDPNSAGGLCSAMVSPNGFIASRLVPRSNYETPKINEFSDAFWEAAQVTAYDLSGIAMGHSIAGGAVAKQDPDSVAATPAWRKTLVHYVFAAAFDAGTTAAQRLDIENRITNDAQKKLVDITPGSGAYFNEASSKEAHWQQSFFGNHYDRLVSIKRKWDPKHLFVCLQCVGSEDFEGPHFVCRK